MVRTKAASRPATRRLQAIFGENVRLNRVAMDLSQADLARAAGHTQQYISQIEVGEINVTLNTMNILATTFGVTISDLLSPPRKKT